MFVRRNVALLLALSLSILAQQAAAAEPQEKSIAAVPPEASAKKACTTATGATKTECEKVATQIDAQKADPQAHPMSDDNDSSQEVHHSSPAMVTPQEKAEMDRKDSNKAKTPSQKTTQPKPVEPKQ